MLIWLRSLMCSRLSFCVRSLSLPAASPPFPAAPALAGAEAAAYAPPVAGTGVAQGQRRTADLASSRPPLPGPSIPSSGCLGAGFLDQLHADLPAGDPPLGPMPCPIPRFDSAPGGGCWSSVLPVHRATSLVSSTSLRLPHGRLSENRCPGRLFPLCCSVLIRSIMPNEIAFCRLVLHAGLERLSDTL